MKLKTISLIGLLFTTLISSGNAFAQKVIQFIIPERAIAIDKETANKLNLDLDKIKSALKTQDGDEVFAIIDENGDIIDLGIYQNTEFASSRIDRDGASH